MEQSLGGMGLALAMSRGKKEDSERKQEQIGRGVVANKDSLVQLGAERLCLVFSEYTVGRHNTRSRPGEDV